MQRSAPRVAKNTAAQLAARGLEGASNFVVTILLARVLGAGPLGAFAFLTTYASLFIFLGTFGLNTLMMREVARRREQARRYLNNALGMALPLAVLTFGLQVGIIRLVSADPVVHRGAYLAAVFAILQSWELLFIGIFYALERMELETIGIFLEKTVLIGAVFALVLTGGGVLAVLAAFTAAAAFIVLVYLALSWRLLGFPRPGVDLALWRDLALQAWPFSLSTLFAAVDLRINLVLLAILASERAAGYFRAGSIFAFSLPIVASSLNRALLPLMARAHLSHAPSFELALERSSKVLSLFGMPVAAGLFALAHPLARLCFGARFDPAIPVFQVLALSVPLKFAVNTVGVALTAVDRQPQRTAAAALGTGLSVLLSIVLIPWLAQTGAAIAALATDAAILALLCLYLRRTGYRLDLFGLSARPALAAAAMGALVWLMRGANLALAVGAGIVIYSAAAVAVGAVRGEDLAWVRRALTLREPQIESSQP